MKSIIKVTRKITILLFIYSLLNVANAAVIHWADWTSGTNTSAQGEFVTPTSQIDISYENTQGIAFLQKGVGIDFYRNLQDISISPYTSDFVDNIPPPAEMVALQYQGTQTLSFSETVANPVFAYVSLNRNGYAFDQDFEILSVGDGVDNLPGYWGTGTSYKEVVDLGSGVMEYRLLGTGEPHGTLRFTGAFDEVSWQSLSNEYWNGFTVGIEGTAEEIFNDYPGGSNGGSGGVVDVAEPGTLGMFALGLIVLGFKRLKNRALI